MLVLGEFLVRRSRLLSRCHLPPAIVGGLLVASILAMGTASGVLPWRLQSTLGGGWWTWLVTHGPRATTATVEVSTPFMLAFFACLGLNTRWAQLKLAGPAAIAFLGLATLLALVQNLAGLGLARLLSLPPLFGLACGSVSLTGGYETATGFASSFERAGLPNALPISTAVATLGVVLSPIVGGMVGGLLIRRRHLQPAVDSVVAVKPGWLPAEGFWHDLRSLLLYGRPFVTHALQTVHCGILADLTKLARFGKLALAHLALVLLCVKLGSMTNAVFEVAAAMPVYIGTMLVGIAIRHLSDRANPNWIRSEIIDVATVVLLGFFLTLAMMTIDLRELRHCGVPILLIVLIQVAIIICFTWLVTFRFMGRNFDAAVMASGHVGLGLGETPNAIANINALTDSYGASRRAFLVIVLGSSFCLKIANGVIIALFIGALKI